MTFYKRLLIQFYCQNSYCKVNYKYDQCVNKIVVLLALDREVQWHCLAGGWSNTWVQVRRLIIDYDDDHDDDYDDHDDQKDHDHDVQEEELVILLNSGKDSYFHFNPDVPLKMKGVFFASV